jgi:hypothetical protein
MVSLHGESHQGEAMTRVRATLGAFLALLIVAGYAWLPGAAVDLLWRRPPGPPVGTSRIVTLPSGFDLPRTYPAPAPERLGEVPRTFDIRGNEIARPVARYRVDHRGSLYEVHSPDTEVPRLKPPQL